MQFGRPGLMAHLPICPNQARFSHLRTQGPGGQFFGPPSLAAEPQATGILQETARISDPGSTALSHLPPSGSSRWGGLAEPLSLSSVAGCGPPAIPRSPPLGTLLHVPWEPVTFRRRPVCKAASPLGGSWSSHRCKEGTHLLDISTRQADDGGGQLTGAGS